ncbi:hypothetical protein V1514DRAFT_338145 [Lipomyces japonicus]|uniref:uncharacterized protein n=1 Tax=Lipomyces japonicus TaxID=56871 RepID=UPI0034CEFD49
MTRLDKLPSSQSITAILLIFLVCLSNVLAAAVAPSVGLQQQAGDILKKETLFDGNIVEFYYLERPEGSKDTDETIIIRTSANIAHISHDHGATWAQIDSPADVIAIYPHPYNHDYVYLITNSAQIAVSTDRGKSFKNVKVPTVPNTFDLQYLTFHKSRPDWLIWHGKSECNKIPAEQVCALATAYSKNNGKSWTSMIENARQCLFITGLQQPTNENLVFCERLVSAGGIKTAVQLTGSTDFYKNSKNEVVFFQDIIGFTALNEFVIAAAIAQDGNSLRADISVDGVSFAEAKFPPTFKVSPKAYTILDTTTKSILLHVTASSQIGSEYGTILKSNSNGTQYSFSIDNVNRNVNGFVDFEKMQGLEGISIINTLSNPQEVASGGMKKLRTKITFTDGASWQYLEPPTLDSDGQPYGCRGALDRCSLNLHGYTERTDVRDTYSSGSAIGLLIGVGNVGDSLTSYAGASTYLTRDGGFTWQEIYKGTFMWEFGDQGSIIVLVEDKAPTNTILYSFDEGATWSSFQFYDEVIQVTDISTVPSDTSRRFLIFGVPGDNYGGKSIVLQLDFTPTTDKQCVLDAKNPADDDFELWTPYRNDLDNSCLFGHEVQYHRKIPDHFCYVGDKIPQPHEVVRNCTCTRADFECDVNYAIATDGTCQLINGYTAPDHSVVCRQFPNTIEWYDPTGYRKIPLSTCSGGLELDKSTAHACLGHEGEFDRRHAGIGWGTIFFLVLLFFVIASVIAYVIWQHYYGQYGQIRLGETDFETRFSHLDTNNPLIKVPVIALSAVVAFVGAVPVILSTVWSNITGKHSRPSRLYRGRGGQDAFQFNRTGSSRSYNYAPVVVGDDDEEQSRRLSGHDESGVISDDEISDDDFAHIVPQNQVSDPPEPFVASPIQSPESAPINDEAAQPIADTRLDDLVDDEDDDLNEHNNPTSYNNDVHDRNGQNSHV